MAQFGSLSDRLTETCRNLRTKGRLSPSDVDGTGITLTWPLIAAAASLLSDVVETVEDDIRAALDQVIVTTKGEVSEAARDYAAAKVPSTMAMASVRLLVNSPTDSSTIWGWFATRWASTPSPEWPSTPEPWTPNPPRLASRRRYAA